MKKINIYNMKTIIRLVSVVLLIVVGVGRIWGAAVPSKAPADGKQFIIAMYDASADKYYALYHLDETGGLYCGEECTLNGSNQVTAIADETSPIDCLWFFESTGTTNEYYISFDNSGTKMYLYKNGTTGDNYKIKVDAGYKSNSKWVFKSGTANGVTTYSVKTTKSGATKHTVLRGETDEDCSYFCVEGTDDAYEITLLEIVPRTVTFDAEGGSFDDPSVFVNTNQIVEASGGAGITLPLANPNAGCISEGWAFYGWATSQCSSSTTTAPAIVGQAGDTYYPVNNSTTLHAVYAKGEYTKITSTDDLNTTDRYFFAAIYSTKNYIMTDYFESNKLAAKQIDETSTGKYHAGCIVPSWCYTLEAESSNWHIVDCNSANTNHYMDVTYSSAWYGHSKNASDPYTFVYSTDHWEITNIGTGTNKSFGYYSTDNTFKQYTTAQNILIYKVTSTPYYYSNPSCCEYEVSVSESGSSHITSMTFSASSVATCGDASSRTITITVTPASGYSLFGTTKPVFTKTSGTVTATIGSVTDNGDGTFSYECTFNSNDNGVGTFAISPGQFSNYRTACSTTYDITLNKNGGDADGSAKVDANGTQLKSISAPTKSGYDVEGYYTTSGVATKIATDAGVLQNGSGSGITVGGNAWTNSSSQWVRGAGETFYTKWTAHNYTITYEGLEGASNTNPTSYNIETATIVLANPGARTGYTFSGWTLGGDPITSITIGSTGDKTITATWSINTPNLAVSAADHVVITATPASESAIAEGANRNVNYNKTVTLNCTPDDHWNLVWDVYKTGETATKVAVTGSGDGATFTMPDYAVTVTAVMTEDTYHTATFKNNGTVIDGYDAVKTYDGERPSAPTLTDVTDACDKTDCNKFYGWISEDGIWNKTIDNVAGKTIYRRASDIPNVSGADVVYHAVWAKGEAGPELSAPTPIIYWARQSIAASTNISATSGTGTLNSNVAFTDATYEKVYNSGTLSSYPTITLSGLDMSGATGSTVNISFFTRGTNASAGTLTVKYTDSGNEYTAGTVTVVSKQVCYHEVSGIPKTATQIKLEHGANGGNLAIGTIKIFEPLTTSYTFTELTSENTSGWANADWDGYYLITNGQVSLQALDGNGIGEKNITSVTASDGVISTTNAGAAFKVTWVSGSGYKMQGVGSGDYLNTASNSVAPSASVVYMSEIGYNSITDGSSNKLYWNSSKFGFYSSTQTSPVLYKIMESFTEFRITCCDKTVTIGTPDKTGSGTVTFESGGDTYAAGDEVETCEGETTITATVTPTNGYNCSALSFSRADGEDIVIDVDPATAVPFTTATDFVITVEKDANTTLNTTVTFTQLHDYYIDNMHYNTTQNKSGNYGTAPSLSNETKGEECTGLHYKFIGWIPESDMNMTTGVPTTTANMVAGGATGKYATGTNYYAIWAEEVTP